MNVEIGTEPPTFLFWEYLFGNFGILSLQCVPTHIPHKIKKQVDRCAKKSNDLAAFASVF
jgi:hypothetical protein